MKALLKVIILTAVFIAILKSCSPFLGTRYSLVGQPAPDFTLKTLNGQEVNMTRFRDGQPAMIFFWATWCPHCRRQLKELTRQHETIEANGIKLILVDVAESPQIIRNYITAHNISLAILLDQDGTTARDYGIIGVPTFFFINREGIVVAAKNFLPDQYESILLDRVL